MRQYRRFIVVLSALAALLAWIVPASAATFGIEAFGAYNQYAMNDVNDELDAANVLGANFDNINGSIGGGAGVRLWATPSWMISAAWEPLRAETESNPVTINAGANSFQFSATHFFPSTTTARYGIGAGVGYYSLTGNYEDTSDPSGNFDFEGSGAGFHFMGMGEWKVNDSFALTGGAGYRIADIEIKDSDGMTANYSGMLARVGFAFYMPQSK